jgi:hypothetical protein
MNQKAYQQSNLIELMNAIVQERRGEIFLRGSTPPRGGHSGGGMHDREGNLASKVSSQDPGLSSPETMRRTGTLRKSIMQSSGLNYAMNRNAEGQK